MQLDKAVAKVLGIEPSQATLSSAGGGGCSSASTSKITAKHDDGSQKEYFMKRGTGSEFELMFRGEHDSLNAIHAVVPLLAPRSYGFGTFSSSSSTYFLVTDFITLGVRSSGSVGKKTESLATKLAKLHTTAAPTPNGHSKPMFGFEVTTCCGDTPQDNSFTESWANFYANCRIRFIGERCKRAHGPDPELEKLVETTASKVVPRLLADEHLGGSARIQPVVVHGDLWSGNAGRGRIGNGPVEDIVYDPSAFYAHGEYELGIMKMFGGFGGSFLEEYHKMCPKTEPTEEYADRVALYELYHQLNHTALFGGGYRSSAMRTMKKLITKYGNSYDRI